MELYIFIHFVSPPKKIENNIYFNNFKIINMENGVKQKCTNCKCYRVKLDFIGKSGDIVTVKRC